MLNLFKLPKPKIGLFSIPFLGQPTPEQRMKIHLAVGGTPTSATFTRDCMKVIHDKEAVARLLGKLLEEQIEKALKRNPEFFRADCRKHGSES
ncbi:MAG: hypothetical protein ACPGXK_03815 [Phycisphaerae bacterium]